MPKFPEIQEISNEPGTKIEPDTYRRVLVNDPDDNNDVTFNSSESNDENARVRIGQYLSDVTKGNVGSTTHPNKFSIDRTINEGSTQNAETGRPSGLNATENSQFWIDRQEFQAGSVSVDGTLINPDPTKIGFGETWQRGESDNQEIQDGHQLLRVPVDEGTKTINVSSPVHAITSAVLKNNRFTADNRLNPTVAAGNRDEPENGFNPSIRLPDPNERTESLGKYNRGISDTTFNNLAKIGMVLSLRGSGEVGAGDENYNPLSAGEEAKAILPSAAQLGVVRTDWETLRPADVIKRLADNEIDDSVLTDLGQSWGVMNNIYDPFDGITATGMPILAFTLILTMLAAAELISFIVELIAPGKPLNAPTKHTDGRYVFGKWQTEFPPPAKSGGFGPSFNFEFPPPIGEILGIKQTQYSFGKSLQKGTYLFFGIERSLGGVTGAAIGAAASSIGLGGLVDDTPTAPGYNAVFCRAVMRSTLTIIDSMKRLASSPNAIAGIKNFLAIFEIIKRSKLIAAINVFTSVGDLALSQMEANEVNRDNLTYASEIDSIENNSPDAAITKSKLQGTNKLAWAGNRTPSLFLMPATVFGMNVALQQSAASGLGGPAYAAIPSEALSKNSFALIDAESDSIDNRIPSKGENPTDEKPNVQLMEETLESEYVPFYLHDIRTNEIISFHAFLNNLSEDFTPSWETTDGYGRIDQVAIYKSTQRKLNFSFWVVSTGHADFNDMWVKLNKLVTLVYPQWTRGRKLSTPDYTFTMPFSQIPSASPIVRLRIGDLVRSNYSRFNLSRIFGMGDQDGIIDGNEMDFSVTADDYNKAIKDLEKIRQAPWSDSSLYFSFRADRANLVSSEGVTLSMPSPMGGGSADDPAGAPLRIPANLLPFFKLKPEGQYSPEESSGLNVSVGISIGGGTSSEQPIENQAGIFSIEQMTQSDIVKNFNVSARVAATIFNKTKKFVEHDALANRPPNDAIVKDRKYIFPIAWVDMLPSSRAEFLAENGLLADSGSAEALANFMKPGNNAIVKSFEDTGGMGLACRIDSLSFDWLDQVTWETVAPGEKAPQRVKVTMSVTAIHDIAPGIDNKGYNRAPIWPIGPMNTRIDRNA